MSFKPSIKLTLLLFALAFVFVRLGMWQMERKSEKQMLFDQFENAPALSLAEALQKKERFARVEISGHYDSDRHVLLDNRILNGRAGVHVLTPFISENGTQILVNRGWLPLAADRRSLPAVMTDSGMRVITGILNRPSTKGPRIGGEDILVRDDWPQLVTYLDLQRVGEALEVPIEPWVVQLDTEDDSGFEGRQWRAAVMEPKVHGAYAVQWFGLAAAAFVIWIILGVRQARSESVRKKAER